MFPSGDNEYTKNSVFLTSPGQIKRRRTRQKTMKNGEPGANPSFQKCIEIRGKTMAGF
jgi:hypothetical protein